MKRASVSSSQLREQYTLYQKEKETATAHQHTAMMEEELRKFRREQLSERQALEKQLLIEVCLLKGEKLIVKN